jgi:hypothetical protein
MPRRAVALFIALAFTAAFGCRKLQAPYTLNSKARLYMAFFGRNSWWQYSSTNAQDTFTWTAYHSNLGTVQESQQYEMFTSSVGPYDNNSMNECDYYARADRDTDYGGILGQRMFFNITTTENSVTGDGNLPLESNVVVDGKAYNDVLHLVNYHDTVNESHFINIWIAPNVGIIKMSRWRDTTTYYLKSYKVMPVNS